VEADTEEWKDTFALFGGVPRLVWDTENKEDHLRELDGKIDDVACQLVMWFLTDLNPSG
jgi:hypothetical protein